MSLSYTAAFDQKSLTAAIRHLLRQTTGFVYLIAALSAVYGLAQLLHDDVIMGVGGLVAAAFVAIFFPVMTVRRSVAASMRNVGRPTTYDFGPAGFSVRNELFPLQWSWAVVSGVEEKPGYVVIRLQKTQFTVVPTSGLGPEQLATLHAILAARGSQAGAVPGTSVTAGEA